MDAIVALLQLVDSGAESFVVPSGRSAVTTPEVSASHPGLVDEVSELFDSPHGDDLDLWGGDDVPDFLATETPTAPVQHVLQRAPTAAPSPRRAEAERVVAALAGSELRALVVHLERHGNLQHTDGEAAWAVLQVVQQADTDATVTPHSPLCDLLTRAIESPDLELTCLGFDAAARLRASAVQETIAKQLRDRPATLGFDGIERALASLGVLGDGRCVRTMEEALLHQAPVFTEHQAWRGRHIVQLIRRDHRR